MTCLQEYIPNLSVFILLLLLLFKKSILSFIVSICLFLSCCKSLYEFNESMVHHTTHCYPGEKMIRCLVTLCVPYTPQHHVPLRHGSTTEFEYTDAENPGHNKYDYNELGFLFSDLRNNRVT